MYKRTIKLKLCISSTPSITKLQITIIEKHFTRYYTLGCFPFLPLYVGISKFDVKLCDVLQQRAN